MKKMALMLAVVMMLGLGVVMVGGPALAQDHDNITTITTANSAFFGFRATPSNLQTFTANTTTISCGAMDAAGNMTCDGGTYVRNNTMPGAYTSRPDTGANSVGNNGTRVVVSAFADFGCGDTVATASACDELATSLHDNVNNDGHNTAPGTGGTIVTDHDGLTTTISGNLVGDLHSQVAMMDLDGASGMPSGTITFDRTEGRDVSFNQEINQVFGSFLSFSEIDGTGTNTWVASGGGPSNSNIGRLSGGPPGFPSYIPTAGLPIVTTLSITQAAFGDDADCSPSCGNEVIGGTVNFPGNGTFPVTGAFFTPGLGIADWAGSTAAVDTDGFPN